MKKINIIFNKEYIINSNIWTKFDNTIKFMLQSYMSFRKGE